MPNTLENTREFDETIVEEDEEVAADEATDEFAEYFQNGLAPKILITTSKGPSAVRTRTFFFFLPWCYLHRDWFKLLT